MNRVCFVNGSPRGKNSCSMYLIELISGMLDREKSEIDEICIIESLKSQNIHSDFEKMLRMDKIVFVFPLYIDAMPSTMLDFMLQFDEYITGKGDEAAQHIKRVHIYAVINNGFVEGSQNANAANIMRHFASRLGFEWRLAIGIGAGEFFKVTQKSIPLKSRMKCDIYEAIVRLAADIETRQSSLQSDIFVSPAMPRFIFIHASNFFWTSSTKKSRKALSIRPY